MGSKAYLVLENGKVFSGKPFGAVEDVMAEVVFTTGMTGYLETLTDKSFFGQIVVQTFPLVGNYGVIPSDFEGEMIGPSGYIVKQWCQEPSNFRSEGSLDTFFRERGIVGLSDVDTRALTRIIRENGVMNGVITSDPDKVDFEKLKAYKVTNAVEGTSTKEIQTYPNDNKCCSVAVVDYGMLKSLRTKLERFGAEVTVCPHNVTAQQLEELGVDAIVLSDGPGDPTDCKDEIEAIKEIVKLNKPIFAVGMGHELLALANGFKTEKLTYGHRGANQPVKNIDNGRVYVTSQNHGYAVVASSIDTGVAEAYFVNVNDNTCEGIRYKSIPAVSVQFTPDAGNGSADTTFLLKDFINKVAKN